MSNTPNSQNQDGTWEVGGTLEILSGGSLIVDGETVTAATDLSGVTASAAEINLIDGAIAGTSVASKALALGASKDTDVLLVTTTFTSNGVTAIGNAAGDKVTFHGAGAQSGAQSALVADAPAGGTGATAGAYDTAEHRDELIALVNAMKACLVNHGLMAAA